MRIRSFKTLANNCKVDEQIIIPVSHARYLITVIPPAHNSTEIVCVLVQPEIGFSKIVQYVSSSDGIGALGNLTQKGKL